MKSKYYAEKMRPELLGAVKRKDLPLPIHLWTGHLIHHNYKPWRGKGLRRAQWGSWTPEGLLCEAYRKEVARGFWDKGDKFCLKSYSDSYAPEEIRRWGGVGKIFMARCKDISLNYKSLCKVNGQEPDGTGLNHLGRLIETHWGTENCMECRWCYDTGECMFQDAWRDWPKRKTTGRRRPNR